MKILHVVGARPNFMKAAPILRQMGSSPSEFQQILVHTGQHYDASMSDVFFTELGMPKPDVNLEVGSGSHTVQTAQVMLKFEPVVREYQPDWVVVVGDVNSTLACSLVCSKLGVKIAHVEAGLRSGDRSMPEEINRLLTDQLADLLLTPSTDGDENLLREGISREKIHFVGNVMIDTLVQLLPKAEQRWQGLAERFQLGRYLLVTLHRPSNVDHPETLHEIVSALAEASHWIPIIFPVHPRTRQRIQEFGFDLSASQIQLTEPLGYLDFLALQKHAALVLTDSGGVQEETTYLGIPCLTARPNTERPVTITYGTNQLVASRKPDLMAAIQGKLGQPLGAASIPPLWDGQAAQRIVEVFRRVGSPAADHALAR